jgi:hypothetical protein
MQSSVCLFFYIIFLIIRKKRNEYLYFIAKKKHNDVYVSHKNIFSSRFYDTYNAIRGISSRISRINIRSKIEIIGKYSYIPWTIPLFRRLKIRKKDFQSCFQIIIFFTLHQCDN